MSKKEIRQNYEDGSLARVDILEEDQLVSRKMFRPTIETKVPHPFDQSLSSEIVEVELLYKKDAWIYGQFLRRADGMEVAADGTLAPTRPGNIPYHATFQIVAGQASYILTSQSGFDSEIKKTESSQQNSHPIFEVAEWNFGSSGKVYRGLCTHFNPDGSIEMVAYSAPKLDDPEEFETQSYGNDGSNSLGTGNPLFFAAQKGDQAAFDYLWSLGLWQSPNAAWHAALLGLPQLAKRILDESKAAREPVVKDLRTHRVRDTQVPASAAWVPGYGAFVEGFLSSDGILNGKVIIWESPFGYSFCNRSEMEFEHSKLKRSLTPKRGEIVEKIYHIGGPRDGKEKATRQWNDKGVLLSELELLENRQTVQRIFHPGTEAILAERIEGPGKEEGETQLIQEKWFDLSQRTVALLTPDENDSDTNKFLGYKDGKTVLKGQCYSGLYDPPFGIFEILEGSSVKYKLDIASICHSGVQLKKNDLVDFIARAQKWLESFSTLPDDLKDIANFKWTDYQAWYSNGKNTPQLLFALTLQDEVIFEHALSSLWVDSIDQGSLSARGGPVLEVALRILGRLENPENQFKLLQFIVFAWEECHSDFENIKGLGDRTLKQIYKEAIPQFATLTKQSDVAKTKELASAFLELLQKN